MSCFKEKGEKKSRVAPRGIVLDVFSAPVTVRCRSIPRGAGARFFSPFLFAQTQIVARREREREREREMFSANLCL
jgi:hypothetical protein